MNKSNLIKRLLTCLIGIPAVLSLIFILPQKNFLALNSLIEILCIAASFEMSKLLFGKYSVSGFLSCFFCPLQYLNNVFFHIENLILFYLLFCFILLVAFEIKAGERDNFSSSIIKIGKKTLLLLYPGFLLSFVTELLCLETSTSFSISLFLILVFSNDIFAYIFGMLFGRTNNNIFKASPKKSIAGFLGGTIMCIVSCFLCFHFMELPEVSKIIKFIISLAVAITANTGDLIESVIKRCANVKDSSNIIPGRGGILDCIDSIIVSAPFFYIVWSFI